VFFLTQKLLPIIADGGRIVNLSSGLARVALPGFAVYGALKGCDRGAHALSLAKELGERRIAVNVVAPRRKSKRISAEGALRDIPEVNAFIASQTALGRAGLPDDIGPRYRGVAVSVSSLDQRSAYRSVRGMGALGLIREAWTSRMCDDGIMPLFLPDRAHGFRKIRNCRPLSH